MSICIYTYNIYIYFCSTNTNYHLQVSDLPLRGLCIFPQPANLGVRCFGDGYNIVITMVLNPHKLGYNPYDYDCIYTYVCWTNHYLSTCNWNCTEKSTVQLFIVFMWFWGMFLHRFDVLPFKSNNLADLYPEHLCRTTCLQQSPSINTWLFWVFMTEATCRQCGCGVATSKSDWNSRVG